MPDYDFHCRKCDKTFSQHLSVKEHDTQEVVCPQCRSAAQVEHLISEVFVQTRRKSARSG